IGRKARQLQAGREEPDHPHRSHRAACASGKRPSPDDGRESLIGDPHGRKQAAKLARDLRYYYNSRPPYFHPMPLAAFPKCYLDHLCVNKTMTLDEWIDKVATELDVDGLEFYWGFTPQDEPEIRRTRERIEAHGLTMPMMCYSPDFTQPDPAARAREVEKE